MIRLLLPLLLAQSGEPDGADGDGAPGSDPDVFGSPGESFVEMIVVLAIVLVGAFLVLRFVVPRLSRMGMPVRGAGRIIKVVDRCPLEPKRTVYLIDVAGRHLLIGVAEGSITHLSGAEVDEELIRRALGSKAEGGFARVLEAVAGRKRREPDAS